MPQYGAETDVENGRTPNPTGSVPPPIPTMVTSLSTEADAPAVFTVGGAPTKSRTTWAPMPPVSSRTLAAAFSSEITVSWAPTERARASFSSETSSAMTRTEVMARSSWTATCPSPPVPMTTAVAPGTSLGRERLMAWYGVRPASVSETVLTGSRSPIGVR
ncbi:hypothetical protein GCM10020227_03780 [Streptomyces flavovirens]